MRVKIKEKYAIVGADFSQQEPRITSALSGCPEWIDAYNNGKDLYATIGVGVYKNNYWDNMEHFEDGSPNVEGKARRSKMKKLLLGIMYGMGTKKLCAEMKVSEEEGTRIYNDFFTSFPAIREWTQNNERMVKEKGYIEDFWGRRRRLPDAQLSPFSFKCLYNKFNPLLYTSDSNEVDEDIKKSLLDKLQKCRSKKEKEDIISYAKSIGIEAQDNNGFIARAARQATNASIQGSAATMTKKAMINIEKDEQLKSYGFKLMIGVHDELIGECKLEFAQEGCDRLAYLMKSCVPEVPTPFKCDGEIEGEDSGLIEHGFVSRWYSNTAVHNIFFEYQNLVKSGLSKEEATQKTIEEHCEMLPEEIICIIKNS